MEEFVNFPNKKLEKGVFLRDSRKTVDFSNESLFVRQYAKCYIESLQLLGMAQPTLNAFLALSKVDASQGKQQATKGESNLTIFISSYEF